MNRHILVTYASKYGATKEISEKVGQVLRRAGLQADVLPAKDVHDMTSYRAVILGCAVYIGKWLKETGEFLKVNGKSLAERPFSLFSSGPTGEGDAIRLLEGWQFPSDQRPMIERIQPHNIAVFHGYIYPEKVNFIEKWAIKSLVKKLFGDFRNRNVITSWATSIADTLKGAG